MAGLHAGLLTDGDLREGKKPRMFLVSDFKDFKFSVWLAEVSGDPVDIGKSGTDLDPTG